MADTAYLLDTDVLSALIKPRPDLGLARRIAAERQEDIFTSAITVGELAYGVARINRPELAARVQLLVDSVPVVSFDATAATKYGETRASLERAGRSIAEPDLRIASIALTHDFVLVTGDARHFKSIDGLRMENWLTASG